MFKRMILEDWQNYVPYFSTGVAIAIFFAGIIFALRMKKDKADHMANLPLEDPQDNANSTHH